ncbi:MAG TPA: M48 family metallopeptidase, partial [Candidatus Omnitrophota bacterium]|nr:M48 family metallopeptidase [Candidatus Omnitrophota bacterium]
PVLGEKDELDMGARLYPHLIKASGGAYANKAVQRDMRNFAEPLFRTSLRAFQWEITVIDDETPNSWVLPTGKMAVNKGLLRYVANEHELAAVIAHEMAHAEKSHAVAEMKGKPLETLDGPMMELVSSGYSLANEQDADRHILTMFQSTGHDPKKATGVFRTLLEIMPAGGTTSLFNTHAGTRERIAALDAAAQPLPPAAAQPANPGYAGIKQTFPTRQVFRRIPAAQN